MIDPERVANLRVVFTAHQNNRDELKNILNNPVFREAWHILDAERRLLEQRLETTFITRDGMHSARLNSARVAVDERMDDLFELTYQQVPKEPEVPATYGVDDNS